MFVSFEGIEGVGKTTQIQLLADHLQKKGYAVLITREPGGTPLSEEIRTLLLVERDEPLAPYVELLLFLAARKQLVTSVIQPALAAGKWVLCDRFVDATYAYQGAGRGVPRGVIDSLTQAVDLSITPDLTFILDLPVEVGLARATGRGKLDRFEQEQNPFFEKVRAGYLAQAASDPLRCKVIDADQTKELVAAAIQTALWQKRGCSQVAGGLLWAGPHFSGLLERALNHAKSLVCGENPDKSDQDLWEANAHPDFLWVQPAEKSTVIKVDQVRDLIDWAMHKPQRGAVKVALIAAADSMNLQAANALLKTLEEPLPGLLFILVSTTPELLPATIRSRCRLYRDKTRDATSSKETLGEETREVLEALRRGDLDPVTLAAQWKDRDLNLCLSQLFLYAHERLKEALLSGGFSNGGTRGICHWQALVLEGLVEAKAGQGVNGQLLLEQLLLRFLESQSLV